MGHHVLSFSMEQTSINGWLCIGMFDYRREIQIIISPTPVQSKLQKLWQPRNDTTVTTHGVWHQKQGSKCQMTCSNSPLDVRRQRGWPQNHKISQLLLTKSHKIPHIYHIAMFGWNNPWNRAFVLLKIDDFPPLHLLLLLCGLNPHVISGKRGNGFFFSNGGI